MADYTIAIRVQNKSHLADIKNLAEARGIKIINIEEYKYGTFAPDSVPEGEESEFDSENDEEVVTFQFPDEYEGGLVDEEDQPDNESIMLATLNEALREASLRRRGRREE